MIDAREQFEPTSVRTLAKHTNSSAAAVGYNLKLDVVSNAPRRWIYAAAVATNLTAWYWAAELTVRQRGSVLATFNLWEWDGVSAAVTAGIDNGFQTAFPAFEAQYLSAGSIPPFPTWNSHPGGADELHFKRAVGSGLLFVRCLPFSLDMTFDELELKLVNADVLTGTGHVALFLGCKSSFLR